MRKKLVFYVFKTSYFFREIKAALTIRDLARISYRNRYKIKMANLANRIKPSSTGIPPPPELDLELLQRYVRLRENGKFLNLEINCSDGSTRSVHKYILNSLSVKLGRSIIACKYNYILNYYLSIY